MCTTISKSTLKLTFVFIGFLQCDNSFTNEACIRMIQHTRRIILCPCLDHRIVQK